MDDYSSTESGSEQVANDAVRSKSERDLQFLVAIREMFGLALSRSQRPTYAESQILAQRLYEEFLPEPYSLLYGHESLALRKYRQRSAAQSKLQSRNVSAQELLETDITRIEREIEATDDNQALKRELTELNRARQELNTTAIDEHSVIFDDFAVDRGGLILNERRYRAFRLPNDRVLCVRVTHTGLSNVEGLTGIDLLYERHDSYEQRARIVALQYKMWEGSRLDLTESVAEQLAKMRSMFCNEGLCQLRYPVGGDRSHRLSACAAFLRPTSRIQGREASIRSSGYHVPNCVVQRVLEIRHSLTSDFLRNEAPSHVVFEELFKIGWIGSDWLTYSELESLYREQNIPEPRVPMFIHAQEYDASEFA